jgi:macrolide-specific efflux system membrane fusion protein
VATMRWAPGVPGRWRRATAAAVPSRRRRLLAVAAVVVVLVAAGLIAVFATGSSGAPAVRTVAAQVSTLQQTVSAQGTIAAKSEADLSFGVAGPVTAVAVQPGATVHAGQVLATVDPAAAQASLAAAQASLASAQAKLSSDETAGASSAQQSADSAAVTAAQASVSSAQTSAGGTSLTSPIDGTVAAVNLTVGQQVSGSSSGSSSSGASSSSGGSSSAGGTGSTAGGSGSGGASAATGASSSGASSSGSSSSGAASAASSAQVVVLGSDGYVVNATVDDTEVGQLKQGDEVTIVPDGATTPVYGTVDTVGLVATSTSGVATYPVTVDVTGTPTGMHVGAGASLSVVVKQVSDALVVPTTALHASGTTTTVQLRQGDRTVSRTVTTGQTQAGRTQILSGLNEGDLVVVPATTSRTGAGRTGGTGTGRTGGFGGGGFGGGGTGGGFGGGGTGGGFAGRGGGG